MRFNKPTSILAIVFLFPFYLMAQNNDAKITANAVYLPGGNEVKVIVEARRGKTALSKLALEMKPGTWAELKTEMPGGLWSSPKVNGGRNNGGSGGLHIAGWTDDAHWDSRTGQFLYMGFRQTRQFIAYSEASNSWRVIELNRESDNPCFQTKFGHIYSNNALDAENSRFYHQYGGFDKYEGGISFFDLQKEKWTKLPPRPNNGGGMSIEYFGSMDGLLHHNAKPGLFNNKLQKWEELAACPVDGYHSISRHNPFRNEVLMTGGNNNPQVMARLKKDGKIERLKDVPIKLTVRHDKISIDPATGRYLIFADNNYEFDSDKNEYRQFITTFPYTKYSMPVCAFIPEYGVVMWAEGKGVFLYKHDASATTAITENQEAKKTEAKVEGSK
jgi:hypothetical protein